MASTQAVSLPLVPSPKGREHLEVMRLAAKSPNAAVSRLYNGYGEAFAFGVPPIRFVWLIGEEANRLMLERPEVFRLRPAYRFLEPIGGAGALISSDEPDHLRRRRMVQPAFHKRGLERSATIIRAQNARLFESWQPPQTVHLYDAVKPAVLASICEILLGADALARHPEVVSSVGAMMTFANRSFFAQLFKLPLPGTPWHAFLRARRTTDAVLWAEIARRGRHPRDETGQDVLSLLLTAEDETGQKLSDREVRDGAVSLVSAGFDTTSAALTWTVYNLHRPEVQARFLEELAGEETVYLERVIKETLRLYPPVPAILRQAAEDFSFAGYRIPAGSLVAFSTHLTHRGAAWRDPERFDPDRWDRSQPDADKPSPALYIPFGGGARYCIGAGLATLVISETVRELFRRFRLEPAWADPIEETGNTVHPKGGLPLRVHPR